jgi:hypothetical protein
MSISEIFDHGTPHPWANLRFNNLTLDGIFINDNITNAGTLVVPFSGPIPTTNFNIDFYKFGKIVVLNIPNIMSSAAGGTTNTNIVSPAGSIPSFLLPDFVGGTELDYQVRTQNLSLPLQFSGLLQLNNLGMINIIMDNRGSPGFTNTGTRGIFGITISYISAT